MLEDCLSRVLKAPAYITGCGRTDAQVHASQFFFHMDVENELDAKFFFVLNKILPEDIAVFDIIPVHESAHARFDAKHRTYDYFIHTYKDPFLSGLSSLYLLKNPDLEKMKHAVALLPMYKDYRAFCKTPDDNKHTICNVSSAALFADRKGDRIRFQISADRFLSKMIRIIVAKLVQIGTGNMSVDEFENCLITKDTSEVTIPAHPQGLYLSKVRYPYLDLPLRTEFSAILQNNTDETWVKV